jgi:hypothetical protein
MTATPCDQCVLPGVYWCAQCITHHGPHDGYKPHEGDAA